MCDMFYITMFIIKNDLVFCNYIKITNPDNTEHKLKQCLIFTIVKKFRYISMIHTQHPYV